MDTITKDELARLAPRFEFSGGTARLVTEPFDDGDGDRPASPGGGNTPHWILGHIVTSRHGVLRRLAGKPGFA